MTEVSPRKSDLGVRTASAIVMVAVAGTALWLGGWWWRGLIGLVALGLLWELAQLLRRADFGLPARIALGAGTAAYVIFAAWALMATRQYWSAVTISLIVAVVATDVGAYFAGRSIGGPKIAPSISPSKTWAGLAGGILAAAAVGALGAEWLAYDIDFMSGAVPAAALAGAVVAVVAQAGDFFESWLKRRARVKDSGALIPGHGGLFDRLDGLIAAACVAGLVMLATDGFRP